MRKHREPSMSIAVAHDDHQDDGEMLRLLRDAAATFAKRSGAGRFAFDKTEVIARKSGSDMLLSGQSHHVYPIHDAEEFLIAARDSGDLVLCRVSANATGLSCNEELRADSTFAGTLTLKDVKV